MFENLIKKTTCEPYNFSVLIVDFHPKRKDN